MAEIANESGLLPKPTKRTSVTLGPGERAEVVVDFAGLDGSKMYLQGNWCSRADNTDLESFPHDCRAGAVTDPKPVTRQLVEFRVADGAVADPSSVPTTLRPVPKFDVPTEVSKEWLFGKGYDSAAWRVNKPFDPARIDHQIRLGEVERWRFLLESQSDPHIVHVHGTDFLVLSHNEYPEYDGVLKETIRLGPRQFFVDVAVKFTDHTGRFVIHCHMLEHEDTGMMAQFKVVP